MNSIPSGRGWTFALLAAAICCCAVLATSCGARRSEQYREEGDTYLRLGKFAQAAESYRKAEELNPKNAMAKLGLGRCFRAQEQQDQALAQFREATRLAPNLELAYVEAAQVLLQLDRADEALTTAKDFEANFPENGGLLHAFVLRQTDKVDEAAAILLSMKERFPDSVPVRVSLASAYLAMQKPDEAEAELKTVLDEMDDRSLSARMALIEVYRAKGKTSEIVAELEKLVAERPEDLGLKLGLAGSLLDSGRVEEAEAIVQPLLAEEPDSGWVNYLVGACLVKRAQYAEAVPYLERAAKALPDQIAVARELALARSDGRIREETLGSVIPGATARRFPVVSRVDEGDWRALWRQAALGRLLQNREEFLAKDEPNLRETLVLSAVFTHNRSLAEELAAGLPDDSPLHGYLAALVQGDPEAIREHMEQWQEEDDDRRLLRENALGYALASVRMRAHAVQVLSQCLATWPDHGISLFNLAQVFRAAQMPRFAAQCMKRLVDLSSTNIEAHTLLFVNLREGGLPQEARTVAEATFALFPDAPEAALNLARAYIDTGEIDLAIETLNRGIEVVPDSPALHVALGGAQLYAGKPDEARAAVTQVTMPPEFELPAKRILAFCAATSGDWQKAIEVGRGLDKNLLGAATRLLLAAAFIHVDRPEDAADMLTATEGTTPVSGALGAVVLGALGKLPPESAVERVDLFGALAENKTALRDFTYGVACLQAQRNAAAMEAFQRANDTVGGAPALIELVLGSVAAANELQDRAAKAEEFAQRYPSMVSAWLGLCKVMRAVGDEEGERQALDKAAEVAPDNPDVWRGRAQFFERTEGLAAAVPAYRRVLELTPDDPVINNNLAYCLLMSDGDIQEAMGRAEAAKEKLPGSSNVLHTLGVAQLRNGDLEESRKNLTLALELRPGDPTLLLDYGRLCIAQGRVDDGKGQIRLALQYTDQLGLDFPRRAEAEKILADPGTH